MLYYYGFIIKSQRRQINYYYLFQLCLLLNSNTIFRFFINKYFLSVSL